MILVLGRLGWMAGDTGPGWCETSWCFWRSPIAVASLTYYGVEKPAMNYAKRKRAKKKALPHDPTLVPTPPL